MLRRPLKVLHAIGSVSPLHGGPTTALWNFSRALLARGHVVEIVTTDDDGPGRTTVPQNGLVDRDGALVRFFPRQTRLYATSVPLLHWLHRNVRHYDIVHCHGMFTFVPNVAGWCARRAGVPYFIGPAGVLNSWGRQHRRALLKTASLRLLEGSLIEHAARMHFTCEAEREQASELGFRMRSLVLPLGLELPSDTAAPRAALCDGHEVLYLSRIDTIKRVDLLLRAFALVRRSEPRARLTIAGDGDAAKVAALRQLCTQLQLDAVVEWTGFVDGNAKHRLFQRAAAFVLPSESENFGLAVVEAMVHGLPVIVSSGVGVQDIVRQEHCGLVFDGDEAALAQAMLELLPDAGRRRELGGNGRRAVATKLSLAGFGERLEQAYYEAVSELHSVQRPRDCH